MATPAIATQDLTKYYGKVVGIEGLDLEVAQGEVFGFLGPNAAGKTTTIRLLLDLIRPTRGRASLLGLDSRRDSLEIRRRLGYIPGEIAFYESLTGRQTLALHSSLTGGVDGGRRAALVERLDLDLSRPVKTYSSGTKQKLAILLALVHDPDLLILDEPTLGLDPLMQQEFYQIVEEEQARGKTIFLSSHMLHEVERVCQRVGMVRQGRLVAVERVADLHHRKVRRMELVLRAPAPPEAFAIEGVKVLEHRDNRVELAVRGGLGELLRRIAALEVEDMVFPQASLEDTFMEYYQEAR